LTGRRPPEVLRERIDAAVPPDAGVDDLRPYYEAWCARGYNPENLAWLFDWYSERQIPPERPPRRHGSAPRRRDGPPPDGGQAPAVAWQGSSAAPRADGWRHRAPRSRPAPGSPPPGGARSGIRPAAGAPLAGRLRFDAAPLGGTPLGGTPQIPPDLAALARWGDYQGALLLGKDHDAAACRAGL